MCKSEVTVNDQGSNNSIRSRNKLINETNICKDRQGRTIVVKLSLAIQYQINAIQHVPIGRFLVLINIIETIHSSSAKSENGWCWYQVAKAFISPVTHTKFHVAS